jgi:hypothetical protein
MLKIYVILMIILFFVSFLCRLGVLHNETFPLNRKIKFGPYVTYTVLDWVCAVGGVVALTIDHIVKLSP